MEGEEEGESLPSDLPAQSPGDTPVWPQPGRGTHGLRRDPTDLVGGWLLTWFPFKEEHVLPLEGGHPADGDAEQGWGTTPRLHMPRAARAAASPVCSAGQSILTPWSLRRVRLCTTDLGSCGRQRGQGQDEPWNVLLEMPAL